MLEADFRNFQGGASTPTNRLGQGGFLQKGPRLSFVHLSVTAPVCHTWGMQMGSRRVLHGSFNRVARLESSTLGLCLEQASAFLL